MVTQLLSLFALLVTFIYIFLKYHYNYWTRKGISQPTPLPFIGNILQAVLMKKNVGIIYDDIYRKYSSHDAVGFYQFHIPKLMLRSPTLVQKVMISDFSSFHDNEVYIAERLDPYLELISFLVQGSRWKAARAKLLSALSRKRLAEMYVLMQQSLLLLDTYIDDHLEEDLEAKEMANQFVMTNVSNCVFGIDSNCFTDPQALVPKLVNMVTKEYKQKWWQLFIVFFLPKVRDVLGYSFVPKEVTEYLEHVVQQVADAKLKSNVMRNDIFHYYLYRDNPVEENVLDIVRVAMSVFAAGLETSSIPASNTLYELAMNPGVQEQLYQELRDAFSREAELSYETLMKLPYLDKVLKESLRKYPIAYAFSKVCTKTTTLEIDGQPTTIEAGTLVMVPAFSIHRDPLYYPDPELFDPERFSEAAQESRKPCTYLPFGEGPRSCPGKKFGLTQLKLFLSNIVYKYRVIPTGKTPTTFDFSPEAFLIVPNTELWIRFEKRNKNHSKY